MRRLKVPAGTKRVIEFSTTFSEHWSDEARQGDNITEEDVEGATFLLKRHKSDTDANAIIEKTLGSGIEVTSGKVSVTIDPEDSAELEGKYFATLRLFLQGGFVVDWEDTKYEDVPFISVEFIPGAVKATTHE